MNKLITNPIVAGLWICLRKLELPPMTELDGNGCAMLPGVLTQAEYIEIAGLYADGNHFRSHMMMARHGFGKASAIWPRETN